MFQSANRRVQRLIVLKESSTNCISRVLEGGPLVCASARNRLDQAQPSFTACLAEQ